MCCIKWLYGGDNEECTTQIMMESSFLTNPKSNLDTRQFWILVIDCDESIKIRHLSAVNFLSSLKIPYLIHCDRSEDKSQGAYNTLNITVIWLQIKTFDSKVFNNNTSNMIDWLLYPPKSQFKTKIFITL